MFTQSRTLLLVFAILLGGNLVRGPAPCAASAKESADVWARFASQQHCFLAVEDAYSIEKGTYIGTVPAAPPKGFKTINAAVRFLRAKLPACTVWRDKINRHIIHVVYTKALRWKANPLNQRLTFREVMSLKQVASRIVRKRFPLVDLSCVGDQRFGFFPYVAGCTMKAYETPLHFDVRGMTLREFLTAGLVYDVRGKLPPAILWRADYPLRHGKLTGHVAIMIFGLPLRAASPPKSSASKK